MDSIVMTKTLPITTSARLAASVAGGLSHWFYPSNRKPNPSPSMLQEHLSSEAVNMSVPGKWRCNDVQTAIHSNEPWQVVLPEVGSGLIARGQPKVAR